MRLSGLQKGVRIQDGKRTESDIAWLLPGVHEKALSGIYGGGEVKNIDIRGMPWGIALYVI
ncbi:hypothetical protein LCGC14_1821170, partial [marine sediment metagenome]